MVRALGVLITLPLMTRVLDASAFGRVGIALMVASIITPIATLGLHSAANREHFADGESTGDAALGRALSWLAVLAATGVVVAVHLAGPWWAEIFASLDYGSVLQLGVFTAIPMVLVVVGLNVLRAVDKPAPFVAVSLISTLGGQAVGLALSAWRGGSASWYLSGVFAGYAVAGIGALLAGRMRPERASAADIRAGLRLGLPTVPHSVGIFLLQMGDRTIIERSSGLGEVGRYQVAYLVGSLGIVAVLAFNAAWAPLVFGARSEDRWVALAETTSFAHRLLGVASFGLALGAPVALAVAAPGAYDPESLAVIAAIVAPAGFVYVTYQSSALVVFQQRRTGVLAVVTPLAAMVNLGLNVALVPRFGLAGAAAATLVTYSLWAEVVRTIVNRRVEIPWDNGAEIRGAACAAAGLILGVALPTGGVWLLLRVLLAIASLVGLLHLIRAGARS